jgi:threonine dehydratase
MACRTPVPEALALIRAGAERVVEVTDDEIEEAMRALFEDTHNVAEGAGAAALAAVTKDRDRLRRRTVAIVVSGGNIDSAPFSRILAGDRSRDGVIPGQLRRAAT